MRRPKYRRQAARNLGFVEFERRRIYFPGRYGSRESVAAYKAFLKTNCPDEPHVEKERKPVDRLSLLVLEWLDWARLYYPGPRSEYDKCFHAMQPLIDIFGNEHPEQFGPKKLKRLQLELANLGKSRAYVNSIAARVKRMFKWAVSEEMVSPAVYQALTTVAGLKRGRTNASEPPKRQPVPLEALNETLPFVSQTIRTMLDLHWLTGVRSQSICLATPEQFDRSTTPWQWRPKHKTEFRGVDLVVYVGPKARAILEPILAAAKPGEYLFKPRSARANKRYGACYTSQSYRQAVERGIARANAVIAKKNERLPKVEQLPLVPDWTPHMIRHSKGTSVRAVYGIEGAQAALGHESIDSSQIYAKRLGDAAKQIAEETG